MNLNDINTMKEIDTQNMIDEIDQLPDQLENAFKLGQDFDLPEIQGIQNVLIAGMGGSAIGADLMAAYTSPYTPVPVFVLRDYNLPAWARGAQTLVIASSHSGNTEETLTVFDQAIEGHSQLMAITTGGKLAEKASALKIPTWQFEHNGQPRAAVGYSFGLLLSAFTRLGILPDPREELEHTIDAMRSQQYNLRIDVPVPTNAAKRSAGQWIGRWLTVIGADFLAPVARRWKGQFNEVAKTWSQFDTLPEADHNTVAGIINPEDVLLKTMVIFLRANHNHHRNKLRTDLTKKIFMLEGLNTDFVDAKGETRMADMWTLLHFGDYAAYYLAMAYGVDPTPVAAIEDFKVELAKADQPVS